MWKVLLGRLEYFGQEFKVDINCCPALIQKSCLLSVKSSLQSLVSTILAVYHFLSVPGSTLVAMKFTLYHVYHMSDKLCMSTRTE